MNIYRTYFKIILLRYRRSYLYVVISMVAAYITISIITIYIDNIMELSRKLPYRDPRYIYVSIRTIFVVGGITLLINQYYNIMKSSTRDYCKLKELGATKHNIRKLMLMQVILLIIITIPLGLFLGHTLTDSILDIFAEVTINVNVVGRIA